MKIIGKKEFDIHRILAQGATALPNENVIWRTPVARLMVGVPGRDAELLVGRHELANRIAAGRTTVMVRLVACSDAEFSFLSQADLPSPKPLVGWDREAQAETHRWLVERLQPLEGILRTDAPGRPPSAKGVLRALLSTQRGVSVRQLARADAGEKPARAALPLPIDTFGLCPEEWFIAEIAKIQTVMYTARGLVTQVVSKLGELKTLDMPPDRASTLLAWAKKLASEIEKQQPASLCPSCKGIEELQERCGHCLTTGWSSASANARLDARLLNAENPCVVVRGAIRPLSDFIPEEPAPKEVEPLPEDPFDDPGYQAFLTETAKGCRSCATCSSVPCAACMAGGICDRRCICHEDSGSDYEIDDARDETDDADMWAEP